MKKLGYYLEKVKRALATNFSKERISKFGILIAVLNFVSFMCHRSGSDFYLTIVRAKDRHVQKYIYKNYDYILKKYRDE